MGKRVTIDWEPELGDDLTRTITDVMIDMGTKWGEVPVVVITEQDSGAKTGGWLSRIVITRLFNEHRATLGSMVAIVYIGPKTSKSTGRTYHDYSMAVQTSVPDADSDWIDDILDQLEAQKASR